MARAAAQTDGYIPFKTRFQAWWQGLEPDALVKGGDRVAYASPEAIQVDHEPTPEELHAFRLGLLQKLWGEGSLEPGGGAYTLQLIKSTAPSPDKSMLDLTAGLCGGAKAVSEKFGLWVDAMEPEPDLLTGAEAFCENKGLTKKIKLSGYDPAALKLPGKKYDCIYARERFYLFADKPVVLWAIRDGLKPGGHLLFTDLVLKDRSKEDQSVKAWREAMPAKSYLWAMQEYEAALRELKFDVRIFADETDAFCAKILQGWSSFAENLNEDTLKRGFVDALMTEAAFWQRQIAAMQSGGLRFLRVHAIHHRNKLRLMSDP